MRIHALSIHEFDLSSLLTYFSAKVIALNFPIFPTQANADDQGALMNTAMVDGQECPIDCGQLLNRCMGKMDLMQRVLERFDTQLGCDIETLINALKQQSSSEVARLAHKVRGAALSVSANQLARTAEAIEDSVASALETDRAPLTLVEASRWIEQLRQDQQRVTTFVQLALRMPVHV